MKEFIIKKYEDYILGISLVLDNEEGTMDEMVILQTRLRCYQEMLVDIKMLNNG